MESNEVITLSESNYFRKARAGWCFCLGLSLWGLLLKTTGCSFPQ